MTLFSCSLRAEMTTADIDYRDIRQEAAAI